MYPDSGYKTTHAQSVCTGPFSRGEGPGDEANVIYTVYVQYCNLLSANNILHSICSCNNFLFI